MARARSEQIDLEDCYVQCIRKAYLCVFKREKPMTQDFHFQVD